MGLARSSRVRVAPHEPLILRRETPRASTYYTLSFLRRRGQRRELDEKQLPCPYIELVDETTTKGCCLVRQPLA